MLKRRWVVEPKCSPEQLARLNQFHPLVAQVLNNRGITSSPAAQDFFSEDGFQGNPFQMLGMLEAVERLRQAIRADEPIAVYGDFDADGVAATALLVQALRSLGARAHPYIPHRVEEGLGLNKEALCAIKDKGGKVVVTVDCGIRSLEEVAYGMQLGLDMIVTDHHSVGPELPLGRAVIHPKQIDDPYPFKDFSGAGIAFKLAQALLRVESKSPIGKSRPVAEEDLLDLVAIGTVADMVPLLLENRALVKRGLKKLESTERPGLRALLAQAGGRKRRIDAGTIAYFLGPRLNAAGRMEQEHAKTAYRLLTTQYPGEADQLAAKLEQTNRERQQLTEAMVAHAWDIIGPQRPDQSLVLVASPDFPLGIIGLIASKLLEELYRPAVAIHIDKQVSRGSARSIPEFNIIEVLDECADLLVHHGGHPAAAGFDVETAKLGALFERLQAIAERTFVVNDIMPTLRIDAEADLGEMNWYLLQAIEQLSPFGFGNREPVFMSRGVLVRGARVLGNEHLGLTFSDGTLVWDGIAFRQKDWLPALGQFPARVDIVYTLSDREWNGEARLQLEVKDMRLADGGG